MAVSPLCSEKILVVPKCPPESTEVEQREKESFLGASLASEKTNSGLPLHYGSSKDEYTAATSGTALFNFSERTLIELAGADRVRFLHSFCTNDIKRLSPGRGCEAFVTNVKGKVVSHVWVDVAESSLWLDADAGSAERLAGHLERYVINEDVTITDRSSDWAKLLVTGQQAANRLAALGIDVAALANLDHLLVEIAGGPIRVRRFDVGAWPGFALFMPRDRLTDLWLCLCEGGIRPSGLAAWTALRIEAGLPVFGVDISEDNLAQEVGRTKSSISYTKGCYLGQEPIARLDALGHVNRELRSLRLSGGEVPRPGFRVFSDKAASSPVGTVTSSAFSFMSNSPVAMALLRSRASACGGQVFVESDESTIAATVFWHPAL